MVYKPNIPLPTDNLSVSQNDLLQNFTQANTTYGTDHYSFDDASANNGRHKDIHIVKRTGDPTNITGVGIVYAKDYTPDTTAGVADTQLFAMSGNGGISQLTGNSSQQEGWCWMGGILLQWGIINSTITSGAVTFKDRVVGAIPFPNNLFCVQLTATVSGVTSKAGSVYVRDGFTRLGFTWDQADRSTSQTRILWMAIGN